MVAKNGRVGFGVVGLNFGLGRCKAIQSVPEAELIAVAARTEATAEGVGRQLGVDWTTDYRTLLERSDIDVIAVYTPTNLHQQIAVDAAKAGKHVLTTKPLEITTERIDTVINACQSAGVKLATEYFSRYLPGGYVGYRAIADGLLGKLILGEASYKCFRPREYYTGTRGTWAVDGGGAMMIQAIHSIDLLLWYMGDVASVTARAGTFVHSMEAEDTAMALVTFANGAIGTIVGTTTFHNDQPGGQYGGGSTTRIEVGGERGSIIVSEGKVSMWKSLDAEHPPSDSVPAINACQDFARWVIDDAYDSPMLVKGRDARKSVALIEAIYESARTGRTVNLAPS